MKNDSLANLYGKIFEESVNWNGYGETERRPHTMGQQAPKEMPSGMSKGVKIGLDSGAMPTVATYGSEQEEDEPIVSGSIDKQKVFDIIDSMQESLDSSIPMDRMALMVLSKLKKTLANTN